MFLYDYELGKAADVLTRELFKLKPGETFVITADTESDPDVVDATARAAFTIGAKPMVIWTASPLGVGKAADPMLPGEALGAALKNADAWVEYNNKWIFYSTTYDNVMRENKNLRHLCLVGTNKDLMVRCIGRVNYLVLGEFLEALRKMTMDAKHIRFTTPAGEDLEFDNSSDPNHLYTLAKGYVDVPGSHMMSGQISWTPDLDSIKGVLVFDGSLVPPCGLLQEPIRLTIEKAKVVKIEGGNQAREFEAWLKSFNDPLMFQLAHASWGFNPGARLTGDIVEDERVWGATEWGLGNIGATLIAPEGVPAASHTDGICLNTSAWLDGEQILDKGKVVHKELAELARELGKG